MPFVEQFNDDIFEGHHVPLEQKPTVLFPWETQDHPRPGITGIQGIP